MKSLIFAGIILFVGVIGAFIFMTMGGIKSTDIRSRAADEAEHVADSPALLKASENAVQQLDVGSLDTDLQGLEAAGL